MLGIIGAMNKEVAQIRGRNNRCHRDKCSRMGTRSGQTGRKGCDRGSLGIGKVNAGMCSQILRIGSISVQL